MMRTSTILAIQKRGWKRTTRLLFRGAAVCCALAGSYSYWRADVAERRKMKVAMSGVLRFARSISVGLIISLDYWWVARGLDEESEEYNIAVQPCHQRSADRIVSGALKNGGLYIKLGQGLGSFNQVLPRQFIDTLKSLQDMALAREFKELDDLFLEDFGKLPTQLFKTFDPKPVAAASLAQVFKATTCDGHKQMAVKAQYIDLRDRYDGDIWTVKTLLKMVEYIHPKFALSWVFEEIRDALAEELDFENEGHNLERCGRDMSVFPWVTVPKVDWTLSSKRVLTAEWVDGCKVTDKKAIEEMGLTCADVAQKVITAFAYQLFHTGFVHGDPHPGNVFIRPSHLGGAEVVILDHGLYMPLEEKMRASLCLLWKSIIQNDTETLQAECQKLGVKDYRLLAIMLTGRSVESHQKLFGTGSSQLSIEDWKSVRNTFLRFDDTMDILRALPTSMIFVLRNLNIVRSLNRELGCPVNRFNIMAKSAIRGCRLNSNPGQWSIKHRFNVWLEEMMFDLRLRWINVRLWWSVTLLQVMRWAGYFPQESQILEQAMLS